MRTQTLGNEYNLREVTTAYRTDIINKAAKDGKPFFIREVKSQRRQLVNRGIVIGLVTTTMFAYLAQNVKIK